MTQSRELSSNRQRASTVERNVLPFIVDGIKPLIRYGDHANVVGCQLAAGLGTQVELEEMFLAQGGPGVMDDPELPHLAWLVHSEMREIVTSCAAWGVASVFEPVQGWPSNANPLRSPEADVRNHMMTNLAFAIASADVLAFIAAGLSEQSNMTAAEYREAAAVLLQEYAQDWADSVASVMPELSESGYHVCGAPGCEPVQFTTDNGYAYQAGPAGATVMHHGLVLLGDGHIHGERYTASVSVANEATP